MARVLGTHGPAVLLLPGGAEPVEGFFPGLAEGLVADPGCRVVLHDRPGTGTSEIDGTLAGASAAVHATLAGLGLGPVVVIGQSLGGAVAALLAHDHPEDVAGLVLLDSSLVNDPALARTTERSVAVMARLDGVPGGRSVLRALMRWSTGREADRARMGPAHRAALSRIVDTDQARLRDAAVGLAELAATFDESRLPRVPAAVVTADRKPTSGIRRAHRRLADALGCELRSWPGATHAVHLSHPDEVLATCREIVRAAAH
ncbi:alpha/beta fold hydrolase [Pseudonocardia sp. HH130630-07]|uniref:alpha/beta fold hydrolase n=1 Tax=Pseudonocardia sp. HH130630-07 TaxID=1690815 RepID=UPI000B1A2CD2|nr:alpha/beta hydrolase [Pseudonocardia sp. HH130630-07]